MADRVAIMRAGKVVQVGTPRELYRNPGSPFVAEFLGETNFVPGVVESAGAPTRVTTAAGVLVGRAVGTLGIGDRVLCSIRPEAVRLGAGEAGPNRLHGRVAHSTYLGELAQLDVQLRTTDDAAPTLKVSLINPTSAPQVGEDVVLGVDPEDVVLLANT